MKKVPIYCRFDRKFASRRLAYPGLEPTTYTIPGALKVELRFKCCSYILAISYIFQGYINIVGLVDGATGRSFKYNSQRPASWRNEQEIWTYGFWYQFSYKCFSKSLYELSFYHIMDRICTQYRYGSLYDNIIIHRSSREKKSHLEKKTRKKHTVDSHYVKHMETTLYWTAASPRKKICNQSSVRKLRLQ